MTRLTLLPDESCQAHIDGWDYVEIHYVLLCCIQVQQGDTSAVPSFTVGSGQVWRRGSPWDLRNICLIVPHFPPALP